MRRAVRSIGPIGWAGAQVALLLVAAATAPIWGGAAAARLIAALPYAHGDSKLVLLIWQVGLLWLPRLGAAAGLALLIGAGSVWRPSRWWAAGIAGIAALLGPISVDGWLIAGLGLAGIGLLPWRLRGAAAWAPGVWLALPLPLIRGGAGEDPAARGWTAGLAGLAGGGLLAGLVTVIFLLNVVSRFEEYEKVLLQPWPADRLGAGVVQVAQTPPGLKSDFHDIDLVRGQGAGPMAGDRIIGVAESQRLLLSWDAELPGAPPMTAPMPPWWGVNEGLVMDSASAALPAGAGVGAGERRTWTVGGPSEVIAWVQTGEGWRKAGRSGRLPEMIHHVYTEAVPERHALYLFAVGARSPHDPARSIRLDLETLEVQRSVRYTDAAGAPIPTTRDVLWIPTIQRFLLVPDMGEQLYLVDPDEPVATPWIRHSALNGRPVWVPGLERVLLPLPERMEIWLIDPQTGAIRAIPTQPGVRTADIDAGRGLLLTASVLTGQVLVQRLEDGAVVGRFGTVMPMVRELLVDAARGRAWLSCWTGVYTVAYAVAYGGATG